MELNPWDKTKQSNLKTLISLTFNDIGYDNLEYTYIYNVYNGKVKQEKDKNELCS